MKLEKADLIAIAITFITISVIMIIFGIACIVGGIGNQFTAGWPLGLVIPNAMACVSGWFIVCVGISVICDAALLLIEG